MSPSLGPLSALAIAIKQRGAVSRECADEDPARESKLSAESQRDAAAKLPGEFRVNECDR